jgi:hypothetical protein
MHVGVPGGFLLACGRREVQIGGLTLSHRSVNRFNQREVARALKAARLAGERPDRVEIDPATGRITVIIAKTDDGEREKTAGTRAWDDAIMAIEKSNKTDKPTVKRR